MKLNFDTMYVVGCSDTLNYLVLYGKIVWLKFALIWTTIFICRRFGLMTFFKTDCFHTEQDQNYIITKVWWKLGESFHLPITEIKSYINQIIKKINGKMVMVIQCLFKYIHSYEKWFQGSSELIYANC